MKSRYFFNGRSCLGLGVVWWRRGPARSAPMQRGARFFQKQCFPCSVALVLGSDDTQKIKQTIKLESNMFYNLLEYVENMQGTINETHKQTIKQAKRTTNNQKTHTNIQSNKRSIKQTLNQAHHQSSQTIKERKQTNPKKKPYIKNYATPDRPPPAAAMLVVVKPEENTASFS